MLKNLFWILSQLQNSIWVQIRAFFAGFAFGQVAYPKSDMSTFPKTNQQKNHRICIPKRVLQLALLPALLLCFGCGNSRVIVNGIEEREANEIVVFLASRGIQAQKISAKTTGGVGGEAAASMWNIAVPEKLMTDAMAILNQNGLPRKKGTNLLELFAKQGLMTSEKEETIRYQAGLEQQIAATIRKIDGVIDADVQLSFPPESTAVGPANQLPIQRVTAAVYVKHQGIVDDPNSHLVSKIKRLVAGSVNGLDINDVTIISDRSRFTDVTLGAPLESASFQTHEYTTIWSITLTEHSVARFRMLFLGLMTLTILSFFLAVWMVWKVYPLLRSQGGMGQLLTLAPLKTEAEPTKKE